jgi:hypothetical protein
MKLGILNMGSVMHKILTPLMKSHFALLMQEYMQEKLKETMSRSRICLRKSKRFPGMSDDGNQSERIPNSDRVNIGQVLMQSATVDLRSLPDDEFCPFTPLFTTRNYVPFDHHTISKTQEAQVGLARNNTERHELSPIRKAKRLKKFELQKSSMPNLYDSKFRALDHLSKIDGDSNEIDSRESGRSLLAPPISEIRNMQHLPQLENTDLSLHAMLERPTIMTQGSEVSGLIVTHRNSKENIYHRAPPGSGSASVSVATRKQSFNVENIKQKYGVPPKQEHEFNKRGNNFRPTNSSQDLTEKPQPGALLASLQQSQSASFTGYLKSHTALAKPAINQGILRGAASQQTTSKPLSASKKPKESNTNTTKKPVHTKEMQLPKALQNTRAADQTKAVTQKPSKQQ